VLPEPASEGADSVDAAEEAGAAFSAAEEEGVLPQAAREAVIRTAIAAAKNFFMVQCSFTYKMIYMLVEVRQALQFPENKQKHLPFQQGQV
jgi:hypothetical protein